MTDTTYRLVALGDPQEATGQTALTPDLAKLVPGRLGNRERREKYLLGIERTDWTDESGRPKPIRSVLIEVESFPGEWVVGVVPRPEVNQAIVTEIKRRKI